MPTNAYWSESVAEKEAQLDELKRKKSKLEQEKSELERRKSELEALVKSCEEQFRLAKHRQFGSSSEKGDILEQLGLFDETENTADPKQPEPELEEISYTRRKRVGKREDDLSGLPVETVEHKLPEAEQVCSECGGALHAFGIHRHYFLLYFIRAGLPIP